MWESFLVPCHKSMQSLLDVRKTICLYHINIPLKNWCIVDFVDEYDFHYSRLPYLYIRRRGSRMRALFREKSHFHFRFESKVQVKNAGLHLCINIKGVTRCAVFASENLFEKKVISKVKSTHLQFLPYQNIFFHFFSSIFF